MAKNGSAVNRQMILDMKESVKIGFKDIDKRLTKIEARNEELYNHLSSRLPMWASILFTILGGLIVGLIVRAIYLQ